MTVGSLFAGIGGFDLGFTRAGFDVRWQVEIDDYATAILGKHWPEVRRYGDIRAIDWSTVEPVDVVCGGFPCQPHSLAGRRAAADDDRDLWPEFVRCIRSLKPRWVVAENVPGLLSSDTGRFFGRVLGDLAARGYDAEWDCLPACVFGAPHIRERIWLVAYSNGQRQLQQERREPNQRRWTRNGGADVADTNGARPQERFVFTGVPGQARRDDDWQNASLGNWWAIEPNVGRVAHGIPARVDRLRGLGNAIVPQIAQWIAERIKEAEGLA